MTDDLKKPAVEDFDFIRTRMEELKKEQEKATTTEQTEPADVWYGVDSNELTSTDTCLKALLNFSKYDLIMDAEDRIIENVPIYNPYRPFPINKQFPSIEEYYESQQKKYGKDYAELLKKYRSLDCRKLLELIKIDEN